MSDEQPEPARESWVRVMYDFYINIGRGKLTYGEWLVWGGWDTFLAASEQDAATPPQGGQP